MSFDENMYTILGPINLRVEFLSYGVWKCSVLEDTESFQMGTSLH